MGRGNQFSTHPGNIRFYGVIDDFTAAYFGTQTKFEKSRVVQQVFKNLSSTARFLRKDSTTKNFYLISDADARQVCSSPVRAFLETLVKDHGPCSHPLCAFMTSFRRSAMPSATGIKILAVGRVVLLPFHLLAGRLTALTFSAETNELPHARRSCNSRIDARPSNLVRVQENM